MTETEPSSSNLEPLAIPTGKAYWRSLDHLADTPQFRDWIERRFPESMSELLAGGVDRRRFLQLMAASIGLAGLAGCRRPEMKALPYAKSPEEVVPGLPNFYATAMPRRGGAAHPGREPRGTAHQDRGKPQASRQRGIFGCAGAGLGPGVYDPDRGPGAALG